MPRIFLDDLPGPIGGIVLTDQDFVIEVSFLCQRAVKRLPYESLMVIRHDQNGHALAMAACSETQLSSPSWTLTIGTTVSGSGQHGLGPKFDTIQQSVCLGAHPIFVRCYRLRRRLLTYLMSGRVYPRHQSAMQF